MRQGPLAGRYPAVAFMVMCALIPYLALSAALGPLTPFISSSLHLSAQEFSLGGGLGNAAYALGTVLAVQFAQHFPQRRMMIGYAVLLVIGSCLQAFAQDAGMFLAGHIIQGLCTSLLLIAAVPPLAIGFPKDKLRNTAVIMNMCIFGAVALGPLVGGIQAEAHAWRPLFFIISGISVMALLLAILTFEDAPPANPDSPTDVRAIGLAGIGCVAAFFGASELTSHHFLSWWTIAPLIGGLAVIAMLITYQCVTPRPLLTIKQMLVSSIPVAGIALALFAAAASVSATDLTVNVLAPHYSAAHIGILFLPEVGGAVITALALGVVIQRRAVHFLPLFGMISLAAGIAVFRIQVPSSQAMTLVGAGLTGIGLGATVAPALFVAGFSLPSADLQRVFAIVELLRAVAAFMIAPIFAHFAVTVGGGLTAGTGIALWIGLGLALGGAAVAVGVYALSGARPQKPDLDAFLAGTSPAWYSPPLFARLTGAVLAPADLTATPAAATALAEGAQANPPVAAEVGGSPEPATATPDGVPAFAGNGAAAVSSNGMAAASNGAAAANGAAASNGAAAASNGAAAASNGAAAANGAAASNGAAAANGAAASNGAATSNGAAAGSNGAAAGSNGAAVTINGAGAPDSKVALTLNPTNGNGSHNGNPGQGLVLIAYDGSALANAAIQQAGTQLQGGRKAVVVVCWHPADVGFDPVTTQSFDADRATEVHAAAEATAAFGTQIAKHAGFDAQPLTVEVSPTWRGIVGAADQNEASLIVMGSHRHGGLAGHLAGSVASAVVSHAKAPVLVVHQPK
jgi:nucleotide-binding universal stress UspA family protein/MFS family permease